MGDGARPSIRIRRVELDDPRLVEAGDLEARLFGHRYAQPGAEWWIAEREGQLVGFGGAKLWEPDGRVFLCRAGVAPEARGQGLQKRLIRVRVAWARKVGATGCYTYTIDNPASQNSLIACGFRTFSPSYAWGGSEAIYWFRDF
jgi:GNAT superfamily N-acetyltransferase